MVNVNTTCFFSRNLYFIFNDSAKIKYKHAHNVLSNDKINLFYRFEKQETELKTKKFLIKIMSRHA